MKQTEKYRCWEHSRNCCYFSGVRKDPCLRKKPLYELSCPICGKYHCSVQLKKFKEVTKKQLRAYFLVEVLGETQVEAAKIMGVTGQTVSRHLQDTSKLRTKKQLRAYCLVKVMGETHEGAARLMGISTSAVTLLLGRFYKNKRPRHKGKAAHTISLPGDFDDHIKDIF